MQVRKQPTQIENVRIALGPKGPLTESEATERNELRARLLECKGGNDGADCDDPCGGELGAFVEAIAAAQESLSELAGRVAQLASEAEATALLLEAATTIDMLESDLLEFRFATPGMCREFSDKVRASILASLEAPVSRQR